MGGDEERLTLVGAVLDPVDAPDVRQDVVLSGTTYDAAGRPEARTDAAGRVTRLRYDDAGRVVERVLEGFREPGGTTWRDVVLEHVEYDDAGNVVESRSGVGGPRVVNEYDNAGWLRRGSLRKCRLGNAGRFSTDLDFACAGEGTVLDVCAAIDGQAVGGFEFSLGEASDDGRHWDMRVEHAELGMPDVGASVEFARRPLALEPERLPFVALRVHKSFGFDLPTLPVIAEAEACAEKLARYRRVVLGRDLYDLGQFARRHIDEPVVRRLWVLKAWGDVVDDGRGNRPVDPDDVLQPRREQDFRPDSLGKLTHPVDLPLLGAPRARAIRVLG